MSSVDRADHYGFPIGLSIDFRRAMHGFERAADACPRSVATLRRAHRLLIDNRPSDALRTLAPLADLPAQKAVLGSLARQRLRDHGSVRDTRRTLAQSARPQANVVLPLAVEYGGMRVQVDVARTLAAAGFDVQILQMRNARGGEKIDPEPFTRVVDVDDQAELYQELSARPAALTMVGCWVDYLPAIEAGAAPVIGYSGGEPTLNEDSKLDDRMLAFRAAAHELPVHLVTCSRFVERLYRQKFGRTSSYVPVALDERAFRPQVPPAVDSPMRVLVMAWDGIADKGLGYAIPALDRLRRLGHDLQIVWITPKPPAAFTDLECELHVDPPKDRLYQIIGGCHVMVYTPIVDGLGLPPLEAMAAGVPVIVSTGTGPDEFSRDGVNAICVPPQDTDAIEAAIRRLLDNPKLRRSLATHGRGTAECYHPSRTTSVLVEVVSRVLTYGPVVEPSADTTGRRRTR